MIFLDSDVLIDLLRWLAMQSNYDLWQARMNFNLDAVEKLELAF